MPDNYDTPWKNAVSRYFPEFMAFYFPAAHSQIDWRQPVDFLDQELSQLAPDGATGARRVDKLVRVTVLDGQTGLILVHVEVQSSYSDNFAERMFLYHGRIFDHFRLPVTSLLIFADCARAPPQSSFGYEIFGCELRFEFPIVALRDFADDLEALLLDDNPFALLTAAHILTQRTRHKHTERRAAKRRLVILLYARSWTRERIIDFIRAIGWMMRLPAAMETAFWQEIGQQGKEFAMEYMLPFERVALAKGKEEGLEQGRQQGQAELIARQLRRRFGKLPDTVQQRLAVADTNQLTAWADAILDAASLEDIFGRMQPA